MPKTKHYARIAITLPEKDLAAADQLAKQLDRSRSWVIAEAVRQFAAHQESAAPGGGAAARVAEPASGYAVAPVAGLGPQRLEQLRRDMQLTPEQRVRAAEETLDTTVRLRRPRGPRIIAFDRYEDFLDWKRARGALP
jgi:predicted transcriptional regulator